MRTSIIVDIRGVIASASLKPGRADREGLEAPEYPRRYRLGLIEASLVATAVDFLVAISEALSPRPH